MQKMRGMGDLILEGMDEGGRQEGRTFDLLEKGNLHDKKKKKKTGAGRRLER